MWLNPYCTCFPIDKVHIFHGLSQTTSPSKDMMFGHELGNVTTSSPDAEILLGLETTGAYPGTLAY